MKTYLFFLLFLTPLIITNAFAESGPSYDIIDLGDGKKKWIGYSYERVFDGSSWVPYIVTDEPGQLKIETGAASMILDKTNCEWDFFEKGIITKSPFLKPQIGIFRDDIKTPQSCIVSAVNEQPDKASFSISKDDQTILFDAGKNGIEWSYDITNIFPKQTTFKFIESYPQPDRINGDKLIYGDYILDLKNSQHQTLKGIESRDKMIDVEFEKILDSGESFLIDPTFTNAATTEDGQLNDDSNNDICDEPTSRLADISAPATRVYANTVSPNDCVRTYFEWSTSGIPDDAVITDVDFDFEVSSVTNPRVCDIMPITGTRPSVASDSNLWNDIGDGTPYVTNSNHCQTVATNISMDLGEDAVSDLQNQLNVDWFAIGSKFSDETIDGVAHYSVWVGRTGTGTPDPTLTVIYETPFIWSVTDLTSTDVRSTAVDLSWSAPNTNGTITGYRINFTTPHNENPATVIIDDTESTATEYTVSQLTGSTDYSFRVTGLIITLGNITFANVVNVTTGEDVTAAFTPGTFNVTSQGTDSRSIKYERIDIDSTTLRLNITATNTIDLACNFDYKFAGINRTYNDIANISINANEDESSFLFNDVDNEIIYVNCFDDNDNSTEAAYIITQTSFPLLEQIQDFRAGEFGTAGDFGALDFITLTAVLISMMGMNRVNETVGVIFSVIVIGGLSVFQIIPWYSTLTASIALIVMLAVTSTRKN